MPLLQVPNTPVLLPRIFSSDLEGKAAIDAVLTQGNLDLNNYIHPSLKAERVYVIQLMCEPQSLAWQECDMKLQELLLELNKSNIPVASSYAGS